MMPEQLALLVWAAVVPGTPPPPDGPPRLVPADDGPGWRSPAALRLAQELARTPYEVASDAAARLLGHPDVWTAGVLGDGMLDLVLTPAAAGTVVSRVLSGEGEIRTAPRRFATPALPLPGCRRRDDPVFALVWAHARARSVTTLAATQGIEPGPVGDLLTDPAEGALLTALAAFPDDVARTAPSGDTTALLRRLAVLAGRTHDWLDVESEVPRRLEDPVTATHRARAALATATAVVLARGLDLLGLPGPVPV